MQLTLIFNNSLIILIRICTEHPCISNLFCLKLSSNSMRNCHTALDQHVFFIIWIFSICSTKNQGTMHLLPEKNNIADIYRIIDVVKSGTSLCLFLITSFNVTCCSICSSLVKSNLILLLFLPKDHPKHFQLRFLWFFSHF